MCALQESSTFFVKKISQLIIVVNVVPYYHTRTLDLNAYFGKFCVCCECSLAHLCSVPSKAVCREIGAALWKIGTTDFVKVSEKDAVS